jgi:AGZA family xanthine/uracil permease-like MFS transporter
MKPSLWVKTDLNAFFGLALDNVAVLILLLGLISGTQSLKEQVDSGRFVFSPDFVVSHMIPGTALGVLVGDLAFSVMGFFLARRLGRAVTSMPLGLDTPSTFGMAFLVLLPALALGHQKFPGDATAAQNFAWHVGLMVLVITGVIKTILAPFGNLVRRLLPRASLLGSLSGIALALIAFMPLINDGIASIPMVGMVTLGLMVGSLVANLQVLKLPGVLGAALVGCVLTAVAGLLPESIPLAPGFSHQPLHFEWAGIPWVWGGLGGEYLDSVLRAAVDRLPVILPFALATIVGGIDCTESAATVGDEYDTRAVLFTEAIASLIAGIFGGVIQTTPYIGHPAYKKMGGQLGYTILTALFIGVAGFTGAFYLLEYIPKSCLYPILVFVGIEITASSFHATEPKHLPALALAFLPALAYLMTLGLKSSFGIATPSGIGFVQTLRCVGNGFLISSILWSAMLVMVVDRRAVAGVAFAVAASICSFFGVIHSPLGDEHVGLPWVVMGQIQKEYVEAVKYQTPYHWAGAYLMLAVIFAIWAVMMKKSLEQTTKE